MARPSHSIDQRLLDAGLALLLSAQALAQRIEFALRGLALEPHEEAS